MYKLMPPDPDEMNAARAHAAERAILSFARDFGESDETGQLGTFAEQNLADLLADIAHFCDFGDLSLKKCLLMAASNYAEETCDLGMQLSDICPPEPNSEHGAK